MYAISNQNRDTLLRVLSYFISKQRGNNKDDNMRRHAILLQRKLAKAKMI